MLEETGCEFGGLGLHTQYTQTFENPLIKEYTLSSSVVPNVIYGIFLNSRIWEGLGTNKGQFVDKVSQVW